MLMGLFIARDQYTSHIFCLPLFADHIKNIWPLSDGKYFVLIVCRFISKSLEAWVIKMQSTSQRPPSQSAAPSHGHPSLPAANYVHTWCRRRYTLAIYTTAVHSANFWRFPWLANQNQAHERTQKAFCCAPTPEWKSTLVRHQPAVMLFILLVWHTQTLDFW